MSNGAEKIIYSMMRVSKSYHTKVVLKDISLSYFYGAKIGVLGLNGAGKSSLLRIIAGVDQEFSGEVMLSPGYTLGFLEQEPQLDPAKTVKAVVEEGLQAVVNLVKEYNEISDKFAEPMSDDEMNQLLERQGQLQEQIDHLDAWDIECAAGNGDGRPALPAGGYADPRPVGRRETTRGLCAGSCCRSRISCCLDEPTNHLDAETVAWLERHLQQYAGTVIAVTHDRYFLDNVAGWILELDHGLGIPWKGNYSSWLDQKQKRLQQQEKAQSERQKTLQRELEWIHMSPKGRQAKGKARINAYEALLSQDSERQDKDLEIYVPPGPRLGTSVIKATNVSKAYGDRLLFENMSFDLPAGGIVGIIGPNGAGKTTLFKMIVGKEKPDSGTIAIGETVRLAYVDQDRDTLDPAKTVWEVISGGMDTIRLGKLDVSSRAYVARFNFLGTDQQKKVTALSGGERNRVHLACLLKEGANVLLLDEPTNDLDVNTMRALEEALEAFGGCAAVVSHDRWFLDRIATHILAFEGDSTVRWFEGNYSDYEADRKRRLGKEADAPHRIKYRHLVASRMEEVRDG